MTEDTILDQADLTLLTLYSRGRSYAAIAAELGVERREVGRRLSQICKSIGVGKPVQAAVWAVRRHLI